MSFISLGAKQITLKRRGIIDVEGGAQLSTSGSPSRWSFNLLIDGVLVWNPGGAAPLDDVYLGGFLERDAGTYTVELKIAADPTITVGKAFLKIRAYNNTTGA